MRIDLHVHSNASDGTDAPAEVIRRARAARLDVIALTDHDTQSGIAEARAALPASGLRLIDGMEFSCQLDGRSVHLLGYLFDPADPAIAAETGQIRDDRVYRAKAMVAKLQELGARVSWEQVAGFAAGGVVGRPHLARALVESGAVRTTADAFTDEWIGDGGRAFVDRYAPGLARAVTLVRAAGGVPVLAHPRSPGYEIPDEVITGLVDAGLCGIEVYHADHDAAERMRLTRLAKSLDLIMTGGSDDHGTYHPGGRPLIPAEPLQGDRPHGSAEPLQGSRAYGPAEPLQGDRPYGPDEALPPDEALREGHRPESPVTTAGSGLGSQLTPPEQYERLLAAGTRS